MECRRYHLTLPYYIFVTIIRICVSERTPCANHYIIYIYRAFQCELDPPVKQKRTCDRKIRKTSQISFLGRLILISIISETSPPFDQFSMICGIMSHKKKHKITCGFCWMTSQNKKQKVGHQGVNKNLCCFEEIPLKVVNCDGRWIPHVIIR